MSGIEVAGLVSAIVGIVEAIGKASKTLREAKDIPRAFNEVAERLPLVQKTLQSVESHIGHATEDGVYEPMKKVLENCREKAEQLQEIFRAVAPSERISRIERYSLAVRRLGKGSLVETLAKGMMEDTHALVLNHSAQAATESQVMELSNAIQELSTTEASLPEESAASQMHYGSGDNIARSKYAGNHNEFSGSGTAYFAPVTQNAYLDRETELSLSQLCLRSLAFDEMDSRPTQIEPAAVGTCEWILQNKTYQTWENRDRSLLWIKGKPGSGKSTLLRYVSETMRSATKGKKPLVLDFIFNGRSTDVQKTADGLFRSLLCQIQSKTPEALEDLEAKFKQRITTLGKYGENWTWKPSELQYYTDIALRKALEILPIVLFVDALDECGDQNAQNLTEELSFLLHRTSLERLKHFHICFTCRHYPVLNIDGGLEICMDTENGGDISIFVQTKLRSFEKRAGPGIAEYISKHAEGVFLWASLAVNKVLMLDRERMGMERIETEIRLVPRTLHTLYSELFRQLHPDSFDLIELICFAERPLTMLELHWMLTLARNPALGSLQECVDDRRFRFNSAAMEWDVKTLGLGLIEYNSKEGVIQFIHQSVKDFFVEWALPSLRNNMTPGQTANLAHSRIAEISLRYLNMLRLEGMEKSKDFITFPFMYYAAVSWALHLSKTSDDIQQSFPWPPDATVNWWWLHCPHPRENIFCLFFPERMTLLQLALSNGWTGVLRGIQRSKNMLDLNILPKGVEGRTPLHIAASFGYTALSAFLLQHGAWPDKEDMWMRTPLHTAAQYGHTGVLELLLESGVRLDPKDIFGSTPMSIAIQNADAAVIELLLKKGADVNGTYRASFSLNAAFIRRALTKIEKADWLLILGEAVLGHELCLVIVLSLTILHCDEMIRPRGKKKNPLAQAVELRNDKVVQLLLKYDAEPMKEKPMSRVISVEIMNAFGLFACAYLLPENLGCIMPKETRQALITIMGFVVRIIADMDD